eukprot:Rhum_TRINITY_DN22767_c0_g1::Rhum_TRINITY_DN22767_c0_g1_i1::g.175990::m.175990
MTCVELATKFVELRIAKDNDAAAELIADDIEWTVPTMVSSETHKGKDAVTKFWVVQDKKSPKVVSLGTFEAEGENAAKRTMVVQTMLMKVTLEQTITFNADKKISVVVTKKA